MDNKPPNAELDLEGRPKCDLRVRIKNRICLLDILWNECSDVIPKRRTSPKKIGQITTTDDTQSPLAHAAVMNYTSPRKYSDNVNAPGTELSCTGGSKRKELPAPQKIVECLENDPMTLGEIGKGLERSSDHSDDKQFNSSPDQPGYRDALIEHNNSSESDICSVDEEARVSTDCKPEMLEFGPDTANPDMAPEFESKVATHAEFGSDSNKPDTAFELGIPKFSEAEVDVIGTSEAQQDCYEYLKVRLDQSTDNQLCGVGNQVDGSDGKLGSSVERFVVEKDQNSDITSDGVVNSEELSIENLEMSDMEPSTNLSEIPVENLEDIRTKLLAELQDMLEDSEDDEIETADCDTHEDKHHNDVTEVVDDHGTAGEMLSKNGNNEQSAIRSSSSFNCSAMEFIVVDECYSPDRRDDENNKAAEPEAPGSSSSYFSSLKDSKLWTYPFNQGCCQHKNPFRDDYWDGVENTVIQKKLYEVTEQVLELETKTRKSVEHGVLGKLPTELLLLGLEQEMLKTLCLWRATGVLFFQDHPFPRSFKKLFENIPSCADLTLDLFYLGKIPTPCQIQHLQSLLRGPKITEKIRKLLADLALIPRTHMLPGLYDLILKYRYLEDELENDNHAALRHQSNFCKSERLQFLSIRCCGIEHHIRLLRNAGVKKVTVNKFGLLACSD